MSFFSSRGGACATASQAILWGLAPDGGLYVPSMFPNISAERMATLIDGTYQEQAARILRIFLEDYTIAEINEAVNDAYNENNFDHPDIAPLHMLSNDTYVLELFHGSTLAFKDIALKLLPHLVVTAAKKNNEKRTISILVATSGDTGKAALEGFSDVDGTSCSVFYPNDGVSKMQALQMVTTSAKNTNVIAINGNFDDAQNAVKSLFASKSFHEKMEDLNCLPSSANSINFGRLAPQIVYYYTSYNQLVKSGKIRMGQKVNFVVPTGNFGNILAGYYAKRMGLPINRLICASNHNNILTDFFRDGIYYTHRDFIKTMSPSMDILISSNLERLLYEIANRNGEIVSGWMRQLSVSGSFSIGAQRVEVLKETFYAGFANDMMTAEQIKETYERSNYVIDPHTAVGAHVLSQYRRETGDMTVSILLSTASPYKFPDDVLRSIQGDEFIPSDDPFASVDALHKLSGVPIPKAIDKLRTAPICHDTLCDVADIEDTLLKELKKTI